MKYNRNILYVIFVISLLVTLGLLIYFYIKGLHNEKSSNYFIDNKSNNGLQSNDRLQSNYGLQSNKNQTDVISNFDNYDENIPYTNVNPSIYAQPTVIYNSPSIGYDQNIKSPQERLALERVYNPLKYPYKSPPFYNQNWYPNQMLPAQVIGCGARNTPCMGGSQIPIANPMTPIDISDRNIAPINISSRGPLGKPQQVGAIYRIMGNENTVYPLFGRKKYPNGDKWEYYTTIGQYGVKMPIISQRRNVELGTNDIVFIQGQRKAPYRVTMYENDTPEYIPYI